MSIPRTAASAEAAPSKDNAVAYHTTLAYGGYGAKPNAHQFSDNYFFQAFFGDNPVVPVGMACQQLCTFAYYSRGYEYAEVTGSWIEPNEPPPEPGKPKKKRLPGVGVTASNNSHLNHLFVGSWDANKKYGNLDEGFDRNPGSLGPGTIIAFLPPQLPAPPGTKEKPKQRRGSHVAFVLRSSTKSRMAQFLDTGAVLRRSSNDRSVNGTTPFAMAGLNGGNYDDILYKAGINVHTLEGDVPCCGIGVLKPKKSPADIRAAVARARSVRPLGLARLAIFTRGRGKDEREVLYVSPMVWMHDIASAANYYISRMMWSMRKIPGYQNLQAIWEISFPEHELAGRLRNASRTEPLCIPWQKGGTWKNCVWLTSDDTGQAFCLQRTKLLPTVPATTEDEPANAKLTYTAVFSKLAKTKPNEHFVRQDLRPLTPPKYFEPW